MRGRALVLMVVAGLMTASCGGGESSETTQPDVGTATSSTTTTLLRSTTTTAVAKQPAAITEKSLGYGTWEEATLTLDMHTPVEAGGALIVIHLGGLSTAVGEGLVEERAMVEGLVEEGAMVLEVQYPFVDGISPRVILPDPSDGGTNIRAMADSAACAIRFARAQAAGLGNDDPVVVLSGFSGGAGVASHTALFGDTLDARWDEYSVAGGPSRQVDCEVTEGSTHVDALVGMAGPYDAFVPIYDGKYGRTYQQEHDPGLQAFLASAIEANPDLRVRLIHGNADFIIPVEESVGFEAALADAGYDTELITFDGGHVEPPDIFLSTVLDVIGP